MDLKNTTMRETQNEMYDKIGDFEREEEEENEKNSLILSSEKNRGREGKRKVM